MKFGATLIVSLLFAGLAASPVEAAKEKTWRMSCSAFHLVRTHFFPHQISVTSLGVRNLNAEGDVTIRRLVVRDTFGTVLWESEMGNHPENTDYPVGSPGRDFTIVPAGQGRYIRTLHFPWGLNPVSTVVGAGNVMSIELDLSTTGDHNLVGVGTSRSVRERHGVAPSFFEAAEHARDSSSCIRVE